MWQRYNQFKERGLKLDMSRGKPEKAQLDLSVPMLRIDDGWIDDDFISEDGIDVRNYGDPTGIPEAKRLFSELLGVPAGQIIVGGNSSINMIHDTLTRVAVRSHGRRHMGKASPGEIHMPCPDAAGISM